ncbi:unnamed protein product [Lathyrus sativus]|nr:unnamed protein product [Lathyrus sativus]
MTYNRCPRHCIIQYCNLLDHLTPANFIRCPYLNTEHLHEVREEDATVWTACVSIIRFTTVEMHNSYRVKLQFGMHQNIPDPSIDISKWHLKRVNDQWEFPDWKDFAKSEHRKWMNRNTHVLLDKVMATPSIPTINYMAWYRSVATGFVSEDRYLYDPHQTTYR